MKTLALLGWIGAIVIAAAVYPVVGIIGSGATDAYVIAAKSPEMVKFNQDSFDAREPKETDAAFRRRVIEIYGNPIDYTTPVVFVSPDKIVRPKEAPELILLPVDKQKGENPLQVKSLYFFAKPAAICSGAAAVLLFALWAFLARRARPDEPRAAA